jgi:2-polyprenyl-3-methyl-5-hydroxy-6-metoxy-1,4-benzoquinol methylase
LVRKPNLSISKEEIIARYIEAAKSPIENFKMMSSKYTWENRFEEAALLIPWDRVESWFDVGCGTGRFFEKIAKADTNVLREIFGVDVVDENIAFAKKKLWPDSLTNRFTVMDIAELGDKVMDTFDLVTAIGVIYQCGIDPRSVIAAATRRIAPGGTLIFTTENPEFEGFFQDPHGWYMEIEDLKVFLSALGGSYSLHLVNPLWREWSDDINHKRNRFKEIFCKYSF